MPEINCVVKAKILFYKATRDDHKKSAIAAMAIRLL